MHRVKFFPSLAAALVLVVAALLLTGSTTVTASQPSLASGPSVSVAAPGGTRRASHSPP